MRFNVNILDRIDRTRRPFDPSSKTDMLEYQYFLKHKKWKKGCPFILDWPYLTIPDMLKDKIIKHMLKV